MKEIHKVYSLQNIDISDKHIEVIISQMLRKVFITDPGETSLIVNTTYNLQYVTEINGNAILSGKKPAVFAPFILGITKAAQETSSFLSAASFQVTTKILTDAAIEGAHDNLHGLKENVITGRPIPAGRGLMSEEEQKEILTNFNVRSTMKGVKEQYIEAHDRAIREIEEKLAKKESEEQ